MIWGVTGELREPSNRSGVHAGPHKRCACTPPQDCPRCDGTAEDTYQVSRATPAERRAFAADMAAWNQRRAERAATDLTTDETHGGDVA